MARGVKVFLFSFFMVFVGATAAFAIPVFNPFNNHYYEAIAGSYDWHEASTLSHNSIYLGISGHLATITDVTENNWIWENLGHPTRYLLGATDEDLEGTWKWETGEPFAYTNWNIGEPNDGFGNYPEDALSFWDNSRWNDLPNVGDFWGDHIPYVYGYVAEWDAVPEPASLLLVSFGLTGIAALRRRTSFVNSIPS